MKCCPHNTNGTDIPFHSTKQNNWIKMAIKACLNALQSKIIGRRPYLGERASGEE